MPRVSQSCTQPGLACVGAEGISRTLHPQGCPVKVDMRWGSVAQPDGAGVGLWPRWDQGLSAGPSGSSQGT